MKRTTQNRTQKRKKEVKNSRGQKGEDMGCVCVSLSLSLALAFRFEFHFVNYNARDFHDH